MGQLKELRERAEVILKDKVRDHVSHNFTSCLPDTDLSLYQIELELQNEELRRTQVELEEAHEKYINLYDLAPVGYFTLNENGLITDVNQAGAHLLGMKKRALLDKSFSRYITADFQEIFASYRMSVINQMTLQRLELKLLQKGGQIFHAQLETKAVINPVTQGKELLTFVTDISARKENERWLQDYQLKLSSLNRNNSIDEFSAIIAHEMNHPLGVISNYLQGCILRLESGNFKVEEILNALKNASRQSHRAAEIILRMKNFKYKGTIQNEAVCIDKMIQETITLIKYEIIDFPVAIHYRPLPQMMIAMLDKIQIQQVILNLARNSIEAMKDASTENPRLIIEINQTCKNTIEISVIDNGPGFAKEVSDKMFEPNFTTKSYGIGLGLAVSRSVIEAHGGELCIKPNPPGGVCASFSLSLRKTP